MYPEIVQFPVLAGGSQRRMTEVQLLSCAMGRLGAAGTPVETDSRAGLLHSLLEPWKHVKPASNLAHNLVQAALLTPGPRKALEMGPAA